MKMTEVEKIYKEYKTLTMYEGTETYDKQIYDYAFNNQEEKEKLLELFFQETNFFHKLTLAGILAKLKVKEIIPALIENINAAKSTDQCLIAYFLLDLNYEPVVNIFLKIAEDRSIPRHWIHKELFLYNTPLSHHILIKLVEIHQDLRNDFFAFLSDSETVAEEKQQYEKKKEDPLYPFV